MLPKLTCFLGAVSLSLVSLGCMRTVDIKDEIGRLEEKVLMQDASISGTSMTRDEARSLTRRLFRAGGIEPIECWPHLTDDDHIAEFCGMLQASAAIDDPSRISATFSEAMDSLNNEGVEIERLRPWTRDKETEATSSSYAVEERQVMRVSYWKKERERRILVAFPR